MIPEDIYQVKTCQMVVDKYQHMHLTFNSILT